MIRTRGKKAGEKLRIHQFCNDWISADDSEGRPVIVNPTSVTLEEGEAQILLDSVNPGTFWREFELNDSHTKLIRVARAGRT